MAQLRKARTKAAQESSPYKCRDCRLSYDWHNKALDGHLILCRCKQDAKSEFGKWCKFLSDPACPQFIKREETDNGETK